MNYNDIPSSSNAQPVQTCNISVDGVSEHIAVLQDLIGNLVTNAQDIIPKLGGSKIINAKCNVVGVEGSNGTNKRCYLQIQTVNEEPQKSSYVSLAEITEQEFAEINKPTNKQKKKMIIDESLCGRSDRLALISKGFKYKASAAAASQKAPNSYNIHPQSSKKQKTSVAVNLGPQFDAMVLNKSAPPPPELPLKTLQAIGTGPCKMTPHEVSSNVLNYDSSD